MPTSTPTAGGLDEVVVASTALSHVDGARGELIIHGYTVEALAERARFEDVCALLWNGTWPSSDEARDIQEELALARQEAVAMVPSLRGALAAPNAMESLRAAVSHLRSAGDVLDRARLTGAIAVFAAAWERRRVDQHPIRPRPDP